MKKLLVILFVILLGCQINQKPEYIEGEIGTSILTISSYLNSIKFVEDWTIEFYDYYGDSKRNYEISVGLENGFQLNSGRLTLEELVAFSADIKNRIRSILVLDNK